MLAGKCKVTSDNQTNSETNDSFYLVSSFYKIYSTCKTNIQSISSSNKSLQSAEFNLVNLQIVRSKEFVFN
jgi:hypothetical protein